LHHASSDSLERSLPLPAGYKLFPIHLISAIEFDETKVEPKE